RRLASAVLLAAHLPRPAHRSCRLAQWWSAEPDPVSRLPSWLRWGATKRRTGEARRSRLRRRACRPRRSSPPGSRYRAFRFPLRLVTRLRPRESCSEKRGECKGSVKEWIDAIAQAAEASLTKRLGSAILRPVQGRRPGSLSRGWKRSLSPLGWRN